MSDSDLKHRLDTIDSALEALKQPKKNGSNLAEKLHISITSALTILVFLTTATWSISNKLSTIQSELKASSSDRWTGTHMREYNYRLQQDNLSLKVPSVDDIRHSTSSE